MGNALALCFNQDSRGALVKLVFWGGSTRFLPEKQLAGELMFEFPDRIVCHADSFYIGHRIPILSLEDELLAGETYFVLPVDLFTSHTLTAASVALLSPTSRKGSPAPVNFGGCAFEHTKGADGRPLIKVLPEFISAVISQERGQSSSDGGVRCGSLCSTAELRKHYALLVGSRERPPWSPKLETISECKARSLTSPARLLGLEWR